MIVDWEARACRQKRWHIGLVTLLVLAPVSVFAEPRSSPTAVSEVTVIATTPIPGAGVDRDKAPVETTVLGAGDLVRDGEPNELRTLGEQVGGVNLDSAAGNPFQPSLYFHGFEASPLQGTSEGLAVYVDGVRFNQAFGDTVNWELIPSVAIDRLTIEGSNPLFGLNALGGSIDTALKTGFAFQGAEADLSGGSFGQVQGDWQYGRKVGDTALYIAASALHQDGWRDLQSSDIQNVYADWGWRRDRIELHLDVRFANSDLNGPGTSPIELLVADPQAQFTAPNNIKNRYAEISTRGSYRLDDATSVQGVLYYGYFKQLVVNGNAPDDLPCGDGSGLLCNDDDDSTTTGGATIPALFGDDPYSYSELDDQTTETSSFGASAQVVNTSPVFGLKNHVVAGLSYDGAHTGFGAVSYIGGIKPVTREFIGPGVLIDEPGNDIPVQVSVDDDAYGVFASDTLDLKPKLSVTLSGRYNNAVIRLHDRLGGDLSGDHNYTRFNPAVGASWRPTPWLTAYAGYADSNRAPTPSELSCASPEDSCSLANFFVGDPDLKQVVAHTVEAGLRGGVSPYAGARLSYSIGLYQTELDNDIIFVNSTTLNRAYFTNIDKTRRQGVDADVQLKSGPWFAYVAYSHTEAIYQSGFVEAGGSNPAANSNGDLRIRIGDRLPGVPLNQIKVGLQIQASDKFSLGATAVAQSGQYLFGDEANQTDELPGFFNLSLNASYQLTAHLQLFARAENVTNESYYSYGTFSPAASVYLAQAPNATNPRSYSPAAPIGGFGGIRVSF
jgi:iron complex outermembrane recepter protein